LKQSSEEILQKAEAVRKQYDRDSKRVEELRSELRKLRIERENTAKKLQEDREALFSLNADKIHAGYEKCLTRAMRRILDSHACMIESRKPLFGGKAGEVLVDAEQLSELQDTARFWEGLQEQNRTLQEKLIRENNRCHDLETKLSVQADDIKRKRELIEELGELIMAEKGFTTNEEYVEWYLKNRNVSQN
jgi:predicted  nucleic acid-binding Zn-ribbon protein